MTTTRQLTDTLKRTAYDAGRKAKEHGWERLSPYYEDEVSDVYFFAGYDRLPYNSITLPYDDVVNDTIVEVLLERPAEG